MPGKTKVELIRLAKGRIKEISRSRLSPEEKRGQFVPYLKILWTLDKHEVTEKFCNDLGVPVDLVC